MVPPNDNYLNNKNGEYADIERVEKNEVTLHMSSVITSLSTGSAKQLYHKGDEEL